MTGPAAATGPGASAGDVPGDEDRAIAEAVERARDALALVEAATPVETDRVGRAAAVFGFRRRRAAPPPVDVAPPTEAIHHLATALDRFGLAYARVASVTDAGALHDAAPAVRRMGTEVRNGRLSAADAERRLAGLVNALELRRAQLAADGRDG